MKKKTLLTFAAAGALVATTAGSYAAWDNYKASSTATITFTSVDVTATQNLALTESRDGSGKPVFTGDVTIDVANVDAEKLATQKIVLTPTATADGSDVMNQLEVTFTQTEDTIASTGNVGTDSTVADSNTYTVTITPKDDTTAKTALNGKTVAFAVDAEMTNK